MSNQRLIEDLNAAAKALKSEQKSIREYLRQKQRSHVRDRETGSESPIDEAIKVHSVPKSVLTKLLRRSAQTAKEMVEKATADGIIRPAPKLGESKIDVFVQSEQVKMLCHAGKLHFSYRNADGSFKQYNPTVIGVANQKGGVGKSSTTITLAAKSACDMDLMPRVLVADLDPQGSLINICLDGNEEFEGVDLTLTDLILYGIEPDSASNAKEYIEEYGFDQVVKKNVFNTYYPLLKIAASRPYDNRLSKLYHQSPENAAKIHENFNKIVGLLKEEFDLIYIDTPPVDGPNGWLAADVSNLLIVPVRPHELDYSSTSDFVENLPRTIPFLPSKGEQLHKAKVLVVDYDPTSLSEQEVFGRIQGKLAQFDMNYASQIIHSEAFKLASRSGRTVIDFDKGNGDVSKAKIKAAQTSVNDVYKLVRQDIISYAGKGL